MFDISILKILVLAVLALVIFGPEQLPRMAAQAGGLLRDLRAMADRAKSELQENLGPEFSEFDLNDLNPRTFVRKHLWDEPGMSAITAGQEMPGSQDDPGGRLAAGESPPYDIEAT